MTEQLIEIEDFDTTLYEVPVILSNNHALVIACELEYQGAELPEKGQIVVSRHYCHRDLVTGKALKQLAQELAEYRRATVRMILNGIHLFVAVPQEIEA